MSEDHELVPVEAGPVSLLTGAPVARIEQATEIADALAKVIDDRKLYVPIGKKRYVLYEGWTTLGALLGVFPVCAWSRKTDDGWEARVEAHTLSGAVVGAAEASCSREEKNWKSRDDYALRSMAQTRAGAKALRMPLGFIMALAGYEATPAEEMPREDGASPRGSAAPAPKNSKQTFTKFCQDNKLVTGSGAISTALILEKLDLPVGESERPADVFQKYISMLTEQEGSEAAAYDAALQELIKALTESKVEPESAPFE